MRTIQILQKYFLEDNETFLTGLYRELLNREPDSGGFSYYLDFLNNGRLKIDVLREILRSEEFGQLISQAKIIQVLQRTMDQNGFEFVKQIYYVILGKMPTLAQIHMTIEKLSNKSQSKVGLLQNLLLSEEILTQISQKNPSNAPEFSVLNSLLSICKLEGQEFGNKLFFELFDVDSEQNRLIDWEKSKVEIYKTLINSPEFTQQFNTDVSLNCLKRFQQLIKLYEEEFITGIYQECLNREPDAGGFKYYLRLLKTGTKRLEIIRDILLSNEASDILQPKAETKSEPIRNFKFNPSSRQFRKDMEKILKNHNFPYETNIIVKGGGLGDFIQMTAVAKALKMKNPEYPVVAAIVGLFGSYASVFDDHPYIDLTIECIDYGISDSDVVKSLAGLVENVFEIRYISRCYGTWKNANFSYVNEWYFDSFPFSGCRLDDLNMHVCDLMLHSLGLEQYGDCNDVCITPDKVPEVIPGDYVVVCNSPGSIAGQLKEWHVEEWDELIKWLNSIGIIPVQLGAKYDKLLHSGVMDLRGITTPRQAAGYLQLSRGYIGVEGGLFHLAKAVGAPAVVIFASTSPICFAYPDTRVVTKNTCRPCWWNGPWSYGKCIRGSNHCLNLPDWKSVSVEVSQMLGERREI